MRQFQKLFELKFQHSYFNQSSGATAFQIGGGVLNVGSDMGVHPNEEGCFVFAKMPNTDVTLSSMLPASLSIPIDIANDRFWNYTAIDWQSNALLYFGLTTAENQTFEAAQGEWLPVHPMAFEYAWKKEAATKLQSIQLEKPSGETLKMDIPFPPIQNNYPVQLNGELEGKYVLTFTYDHTEQPDIYPFFASNQCYQKTPFAIFSWRANIIETKDTQAAYTLAFDARTVYLRYLITGLDDTEWESATISPAMIDTRKIEFQKSKQIITPPGGGSFRVVVSTEAVPLCDRPNWRFDLHTKRFQNGIQLPYPQADRLSKPTSVEGEQIYPADAYFSDVYVYL